MKPQLIEPTGCEAQQTSKGMYKAALFYVDCTLFGFTCEPKSFYWLVVRIHFNTFCVL